MTTRETLRELSTLHWVGAGCPAFVGDAGTGPEGAVLVQGFDDFRSHFRLSEHAEVSEEIASFQFAVEGYFLCGGQACVVLNVSGLAGLSAGRLGSRLVGEDNGPGYRTGLQALTDFEAIGTLVAPGQMSGKIVERLVDFSRHRSSLGLVLEGAAGTPPPLDTIESLGTDSRAAVKLVDRCAWLAGAFALGGERAVPPAGPVLGALAYLESASHDIPTSPTRVEFPSWFRGPFATAVDEGVRTLGGRFGTLRIWHQWEGTRRSIEFGTRWLLYEVSDPGMPARVEREVRDFLHGLYVAGRLGGRHSSDAFDVQCTLPNRESDGSVRRKLNLGVRVRLRDR
jgi:hypothetical protein